MKEDGDYDEYQVHVGDVSTYPIQVVARNLASGLAYAKELGLKNFRVFSEDQKMEGARGRALVVTPDYVDWMFTVQQMPEFNVGFRNVSMTNLKGLGIIT